MTTCKSQTEREKKPVTSGSCACPMTETCFPQQFHWKSQMQRVRTVNVRIEWSNLSQSTRAVAACAQSPVLQSPNVSFDCFAKLVSRVRSTAIAAASGLNVNSWLECLTSQRRYNHEAVLQTSRPWNCDNTRKSIQMSAPRVKRRGKKVKQESMPMARRRFFVTNVAASRFRSTLQNSR